MNALKLVETIRTTFAHRLAIARGRRELRDLSDHLLKDIGISRADAEFEARRPFWDTRRRVDTTLKRHRATGTAPCSRAHCCTQS